MNAKNVHKIKIAYEGRNQNFYICGHFLKIHFLQVKTKNIYVHIHYLERLLLMIVQHNQVY